MEFKGINSSKSQIPKTSGLDPLSYENYLAELVDPNYPEKIKAAYEKAWAAKNFEIDNMWKRASYFWAFQVASFAGYFSVLNSAFYAKTPEVLYCIICIGFVTASAWILVNKGSKSWQRNWENHVDMLEDAVTGPLYKTVSVEKTYSVSKINEIVSSFMAFIWLLLGMLYFQDNITFESSSDFSISWVVIFASAGTACFVWSMIWGHGRGRFSERKVSFFRRKRKLYKQTIR